MRWFDELAVGVNFFLSTQLQIYLLEHWRAFFRSLMSVKRLSWPLLLITLATTQNNLQSINFCYGNKQSRISVIGVTRRIGEENWRLPSLLATGYNRCSCANSVLRALLSSEVWKNVFRFFSILISLIINPKSFRFCSDPFTLVNSWLKSFLQFESRF